MAENILNAVVELEVVPDILKTGLAVPIYRFGKNPLWVYSYWGVTCNSMVLRCVKDWVRKEPSRYCFVNNSNTSVGSGVCLLECFHQRDDLCHICFYTLAFLFVFFWIP